MNELTDSTQSSWLVTGAAGFIGSNLCEFLLDRGHLVVGLDNLSSGSREHIEKLYRHESKKFRFVEGDIRNAENLSDAIDGCHTVVHLAALVSVPKSFEQVSSTNSINIDGFTAVLEAAHKRQTPRFIYASSSAIYGDTDLLPIPENTPTSPLSPYAISKLANEHYATVLTGSAGATQAIGLRFFNVFGPGQDHESGYAAVIPRWIGALLSGQQPVLYGDGSASRDFCHVDDVCRVIELLGNSKTAVNYPVYNIGSGTPISLAELLDVIGREISRHRPDTKITPDIHPKRAGDIEHSLADISRAAADLGFRTQIDLSTGIASILQRQYQLQQ